MARGRRSRIAGALAQAAGQTISQLAVMDAGSRAKQIAAEAQAAKEERFLRLGQTFKTEERIAGQEFTAEQAELERTSREEIAGAKSEAAKTKAQETRRRQISRAIPETLNKLVESRTTKIPRNEIFNVQRRAQEIALEQDVTESEAIRLAKQQIIDEPAARAAGEAAGLEVTPQPGGRTRGQRKQQGLLAAEAGDLPPATGAANEVTEADIQTTMRESGKSREEVMELIKNRGLTLVR